MAFVQDEMIGDISTASFKQLILETADSLGVGESTALILLFKYKWDRDALDADFKSMLRLLSVLRNCPREEHPPLESDDVVCVSCNNTPRCLRMECQHFACYYCIKGLLQRQLLPVCPSHGCNHYINCSVLPLAIRTPYISALFQDFQTKTGAGPLGRCFGLALRHKKKILAAMVILVTGHKVSAWETTIQYLQKCLSSS